MRFPNLALQLLVAALIEVASTSSELLMFKTKDGAAQCTYRRRNGHGPMPAILWNRPYSPTAEFLYKPVVDPLVCLPSSTRCRHTSSSSSWQEVDSIAWSLPPLNDYRWEGLQEMTIQTIPQSPFVLPLSSTWSVGLSLRTAHDRHILLCEDEDLTSCYWIILNGWKDDPKSAIRVCRGSYPFDSCRNSRATVDTHQGFVGDDVHWLHLTLNWNHILGTLSVSQQNNGTSSTEFLRVTHSTPLSLRFISMFTQAEERPGFWRLHKYKVIGLLSSREQGNLEIISQRFKPPSATKGFCISFLYLVHQGCGLNVSVTTNHAATLHLAHLVGNSSETVGQWQEGRYVIHLDGFQQNVSHNYLTFKGTLNENLPKDSLGVAISEVRECDPKGDIRVSTQPAEGSSVQPALQCHLKDNSARVTLGSANEILSRQEDILSASRLCSQVNHVLICEAHLLCTPDYCACSPGYYGDYCAPHCGKYPQDHADKYGPGCSINCGECAHKFSLYQRCHPVSGRCKDMACARKGLTGPHCQAKRLQSSGTSTMTITVRSTAVSSTTIQTSHSTLAASSSFESPIAATSTEVTESTIATITYDSTTTNLSPYTKANESGIKTHISDGNGERNITRDPSSTISGTPSTTTPSIFSKFNVTTKLLPTNDESAGTRHPMVNAETTRSATDVTSSTLVNDPSTSPMSKDNTSDTGPTEISVTSTRLVVVTESDINISTPHQSTLRSQTNFPSSRTTKRYVYRKKKKLRRFYRRNNGESTINHKKYIRTLVTIISVLALYHFI